MSDNNNNEVEEYVAISPTQMRRKKPVPESAPKPADKTHKHVNKRHEASLMRGIKDYSGFPIVEDDYYGSLGSLGFFNPDKYPFGTPFTHDIPTTSAAHYYDTSYKKTPIDTREDFITPNLSLIAEQYKNAELYLIKDFNQAATDRLREKTHRIENDPIRKIQAQKLIDIQRKKGYLLEHPDLPFSKQLMLYNQMLLDIVTLQLERTTEVLDYQEKIFEFNKVEQKPLGLTCYAKFTLTAGNAVTKLDFNDVTYNANIPSGATLKGWPNHNLISLDIVVDSGTTVSFATNMPRNNFETIGELSGVFPQTYNVKPGQFSISSLNIAASGGNATVRILGLY